MRVVFGVTLVLGFVGLLAWAIAVALPGDHDPDRSYGLTGRRVVGGFIAFGIAGLSAAYGGLPIWAATLAAVGAVGLTVWYVGTV